MLKSLSVLLDYFSIPPFEKWMPGAFLSYATRFSAIAFARLILRFWYILFDFESFSTSKSDLPSLTLGNNYSRHIDTFYTSNRRLRMHTRRHDWKGKFEGGRAEKGVNL